MMVGVCCRWRFVERVGDGVSNDGLFCNSIGVSNCRGGVVSSSLGCCGPGAVVGSRLCRGVNVCRLSCGVGLLVRVRFRVLVCLVVVFGWFGW